MEVSCEIKMSKLIPLVASTCKCQLAVAATGKLRNTKRNLVHGGSLSMNFDFYRDHKALCCTREVKETFASSPKKVSQCSVTTCTAISISGTNCEWVNDRVGVWERKALLAVM
jgi:hypothetical protein